MIEYPSSAGTITITNPFISGSSKLYKVKFSNGKELLVAGYHLSRAEQENQGILSVEPTEMEVYTPANEYVYSSGIELTQNPLAEEWRKGPNWT